MTKLSLIAKVAAMSAACGFVWVLIVMTLWSR